MEITVTNRAYSIDQRGNKILTVSATFPRMILAEVNTHRMLSKNTSSSRAIPFAKMLEAVQNNPFIPIAWQKKHPGMQGTEYLSKTEKFNLVIFMSVLQDTFEKETDPAKKLLLEKALKEKMEIIQKLLTPYAHLTKTLDEWWLFARDKAVEVAAIMYVFDVTKQNCNRLLEPFMWTTMLITGPVEGGWDNFFRLRNSVYEIDLDKLEDLKK